MYPIVEQFIAARVRVEADYNAAVHTAQAERDKATAAIRAESAARVADARSFQPRVQSYPAYQLTSDSTGWTNQYNIAYDYQRSSQVSDQVAEDAIRAARAVYYTGVNEADEVRRQAYKDAWELLNTSDDPLVKYIYAHCHSYPDHATRILEILPADFPAMQEVARKGNWCEVFDGFAAGAVRQKLIKDERTPQRRKLEKYLIDDTGVYVDTRRHILELVDAEVAAAVKRALTAERRTVREAAAKAPKAKAPKVATPQAVTA